MPITLHQLDETNLSQLNTIDGTFTIDAHLVLTCLDGQLSYTVQPVKPYTKRYPTDEINASAYLHNLDKIAYLAYLDGQLAGQIILRKNWNRYGYIEDIAVDAKFRRRGVGRRLIEQAIAWAKERGLPGLMLETQNNNLAACQLYEACGFHLGGIDQELYTAIDPGTEEIALYWYLKNM